MLLIAFDGVCDDISKFAGAKADAQAWGDKYKRDGTFRQHTQYTAKGAKQGAGAQLTIDERDDTLRLDLQRVIGMNEGEAIKVTYLLKKGTGKNKSFQPATPEEIEAAAKRGVKPKEAKMTVPTFESIWTLFGVQSGKPGTGSGKQYNRLFILNNENLVNAVTDDTWEEFFNYTLDNSCTGIVTTRKGLLPTGYNEGGVTDYTDLA